MPRYVSGDVRRVELDIALIVVMVCQQWIGRQVESLVGTEILLRNEVPLPF